MPASQQLPKSSAESNRASLDYSVRQDSWLANYRLESGENAVQSVCGFSLRVKVEPESQDRNGFGKSYARERRQSQSFF